MSSWSEPSIILTGVGMSGSLAWFLWTYPVRAVRKWIAKINDGLKKLESVWKETQPNGGSSMRDLFKSMRRDVARMTSVLSAQFHANPSATMEVDKDGSVLTINQAALELLGMSVEEAVNKGWMGALAPGYRQNIADQLQDASSNRPQRMTVHSVLRNSQSDGKNATLTFYPLVDDEEALSGYLVHLETLEPRLSASSKA